MYRFNCEECDFYTNNRKDYKRHIETKKHIKIVSITPNINNYRCICNNEYKYKNNLIRHQTSCIKFKDIRQSIIQSNNSEEYNNNDSLKNNELINHIINLHKEKEEILQKHLEDKDKIICELSKHSNSLSKNKNSLLKETNNTINNQQNNTFNINITNNFVFALNEKFPDALTYNDFLDLLENSVGDLTRMPNKPSFIDQISNLICEKMSQLDDSNRPLHYIEGNGENSFYLKQDGQWDKTTNEEVGNKLQSTAKCISKIRNTQWESILNSGNVSDKINNDWMKYVKHITQEVTQDDLTKNILKLKKATILKTKTLQNL